MRVIVLASFLILVPATGCASLVDGTIENSSFVTFSSEPTAARIMAGDRLICVTPCRERVPAHLMETLVATKEGLTSVPVQGDTSANLSVAGNVILGGAVGLVVDAASGRMVRYHDTIHIVFPQ